MNISFDDTHPFLLYSPEWRVQNPTDPALASNFMSTYHACQTPGCSFSLAFNGAGVYLYGSKGPNHGNYSVSVDGRVFFLSSFAAAPKYQQPIFGLALKQASYELTFNNTSTGPAWLDLDFFVLTQPVQGNPTTASDPGSFASTVGVPAGASQSADPGGPTLTSSSTTPPSDNLLKILAITFGALFTLVVLLGLAYGLLSRRATSQSRQDRQFRYGTPTPKSQLQSQASNIGGYPPPSQQMQMQTTVAPTPIYGMRNGPFNPTQSQQSGEEVMYIGRPIVRERDPVEAELPPSRSQSSMSHLTHLTDRVHSPDSAARAGKGKEWSRGTRLWSGEGGGGGETRKKVGKPGANSIRTFVQVMDEA